MAKSFEMGSVNFICDTYSAGAANDYLSLGWMLLAVCVGKDEEREHPIYSFGWNKATPPAEPPQRSQFSRTH